MQEGEVSGWLRQGDAAGDRLVIEIGGLWDVRSLARLEADMRATRLGPAATVTLNLRALERLDTAGAWLLHRTMKEIKAAGAATETVAARPEHQAMLLPSQRQPYRNLLARECDGCKHRRHGRLYRTLQGVKVMVGD